MNFFVNGAIGIGNSGVEHAEFYRAKRFDQAGLPYRFVFSDFAPELREAMEVWGLTNEQVLNVFEYFTLGDDYLTQGVTQLFDAKKETTIDSTNTHRLRHNYTKSGLHIVETLVKYPNKHKDDGVLLVSTGHTEIFDRNTGLKKMSWETVDDPHRQFLMRNIHVYHQAGHEHLFFPNEVLMLRYFYHKVNAAFDEANVFIIDRGEKNEHALFDAPMPHAKFIDVVHADHLGERDDPKNPLWNNYYEYMLTHMDKPDRVIVATKGQRDDFLIDFPDRGDQIVTIPVGGVSDTPAAITPHQLEEPLKLISVQRLAPEKHVDEVIKAVVALHDAGTPVILDIYGQGVEKDKLAKIITDANADDYIVLKGNSNKLAEIYPQYDAYLSASYSEGFGLTYIEALNAALPIIAYKARFGAVDLVTDGVNGFLADFKRDDIDYNVQQLVDAVHKLLASDYTTLQRNTQKTVVDYQNHVIAKKWEDLLHAL
ncbi:glycosyltransferase [Lacticaseibacillus saniviri]|uniref:Glycosyltransferase n=2 Tax=Lacticaseibacillus saniviri TaxID=931533 RepID=A0A0R2MPB9_9LACO|nr:glycosyltransferase [Lacticaseibacillus saniviri]KRO15496.1 glycosyltransferase [Lacticaseibacillus saniviri JCM 17471 = DSM 24301]MCG4283008.1 glycosyltransferase [Lacticaseibacillus saniviri]